MTAGEEKGSEKRNVLVGIRFDGHSRELIDWALVKVADPGDRVIAVHFCRNPDTNSNKISLLLDTYLSDYEGLCNNKQVDLTVQVLNLRGRSIRKVLVKEARSRDAVAVIVGRSKRKALGGWTSVARYCAKKLPSTIEVMAIHNGKVLFRSNDNHLPGIGGDPKPSLHPMGTITSRDSSSEFSDFEGPEIGRLSHEVIRSCGEGWRDGFGNLKDVTCTPLGRHKKGSLSLSSISLPAVDDTEETPGWPLLQTASLLTQPASQARDMSVVQWVLSLPNRSLLEIPQSGPNLRKGDISLEKESSLSIDQSEAVNLCMFNEQINYLKHILRKKSIGCKWFSYDDLKSSTSGFSSENLIGKGGCNSVYKGLLPDGKSVAVKILKSSKEAWKDFTLEVEIMTSLNHRNITPLLGICTEECNLISVYNFFPRGNLEDNLQSDQKEKLGLTWECRFRIAVRIAETLNYLHHESARPVIHRDVKSSNILLTNDFDPQLSDFGLAIWGPTVSSFLTDSDVVGTFGYLAPEYFMYGKVSEKVDVYSFGVVLLELISGRKPIDGDTPGAQQSLVMWAKPKLDCGDLKSILDEKLDENVNEDQIRRMASAARLCLTQSARLRPKMSQILGILTGEEDESEVTCQLDPECKGDHDDDEVYPDSSAESHLSLALLDVNDISTSFSSLEQSSPLSVEEYLRK